MGLDESLFGFDKYNKLLQEIENEQLPGKFTCMFLPRLVNSAKWKFNYLVSKKNG